MTAPLRALCRDSLVYPVQGQQHILFLFPCVKSVVHARVALLSTNFWSLAWFTLRPTFMLLNNFEDVHVGNCPNVDFLVSDTVQSCRRLPAQPTRFGFENETRMILRNDGVDLQD
jgi:hypothetical protein